MTDKDLKAKHLAEATQHLGPSARHGAPQPGLQYHGTTTGRFPPSKLHFGRETHTVYPIKYMVAVGSLSGGFQFYGPFTEDMSAVRWIYNNLKRGTESRVYPIFDVREDT